MPEHHQALLLLSWHQGSCLLEQPLGHDYLMKMRLPINIIIVNTNCYTRNINRYYLISIKIIYHCKHYHQKYVIIYTPPFFCSSVSWDIAEYAPRNLKDPDLWKFSHLKKHFAWNIPSKVTEVKTGVDFSNTADNLTDEAITSL